MKRSAFIITGLFFLLSITVKAQTDSLKGFDEAAAIRAGVAENLSGQELRQKVKILKRRYINDTYHFWSTHPVNNFNYAARPTVFPGCLNEDFEASAATQVSTANQITGWVAGSGSADQSINSLYTSCNLNNCCPGTPFNIIEVINTQGGFIDPYIGPQYPIFSVFGSGASNVQGVSTNTNITTGMFGNKVIRINNNITGDYSVGHVSKTFMVTPSNALFTYAYAMVTNAAHSCCEASSFHATLLNATTGNVITCPSMTQAVPDASNTCVSPEIPEYLINGSTTVYTPTLSGSFSQNIYNRWKAHALDLTPFIGQNITIDFTATDCIFGGHYGYAYVDAQCGAMSFKVNENTTVIQNNGVINLNSCEPTATITVPPYFNSYSWNGPNGFTASTATVNLSQSGNYTLTLGQPGQCAVTKTINFSVLAVDQPTDAICAGQIVTLTASGLNNYHWNTGLTTPDIVVSPLATSVYTVSGTSTNGYACAQTVTVTVDPNCLTGIENISAQIKNVALYPNPNNGDFIIKIDGNIKKAIVRIENALGQQVYEQAVAQGENAIKLKQLASGVYYYTIIENKIPVSRGQLKIE